MPPSHMELWHQAEREHPGDSEARGRRYVELMREAGHIVPSGAGRRLAAAPLRLGSPALVNTAEPLMRLLDYPAGEVGVIDIGHRHFVRVMASELNRGPTAWMWWHDCPAVDHVSWGWFGDALDGRRSGHVIEQLVPLTVRGSLICEDCRDHGFIENFRWRPA